MKLSIVIPARNEAGNIGATVDGLRERLGREGIDYEILVVDDGSSDGTCAEVEARAAVDRGRAPRAQHRRAWVRAGRALWTGTLSWRCRGDRHGRRLRRPRGCGTLLLGGWARSGNAWTNNGILPTVPSLGPRVVLKSWSGSDSHTGQIVSRPIQSEAPLLVIPITGNPDPKRGNMLEVVLVDDPQQRIAYEGGDVGGGWGEWIVDVSRFRGRAVRIVATDGSSGPGGWFGFAWPAQISRPLSLMQTFLANLEFIAGAAAIALWVGVLAIRHSASLAATGATEQQRIRLMRLLRARTRASLLHRRNG